MKQFMEVDTIETVLFIWIYKNAWKINNTKVGPFQHKKIL